VFIFALNISLRLKIKNCLNLQSFFSLALSHSFTLNKFLFTFLSFYVVRNLSHKINLIWKWKSNKNVMESFSSPYVWFTACVFAAYLNNYPNFCSSSKKNISLATFFRNKNTKSMFLPLHNICVLFFFLSNKSNLLKLNVFIVLNANYSNYDLFLLFCERKKFSNIFTIHQIFCRFNSFEETSASTSTDLIIAL
jgi:hypothetical protein